MFRLRTPSQLRRVVPHSLCNTVYHDYFVGVVHDIRDGVFTISDAHGQTIRVSLLHAEMLDPDQPCGNILYKFLDKYVLHQNVLISWEYLGDGASRGIYCAPINLADHSSIDDYIVASGWGFAGDLQREETTRIERRARESQFGMWEREHVMTPLVWRRCKSGLIYRKYYAAKLKLLNHY